MPALGYQHRYAPFPDPREIVPGLPDEVCRVLIQGSAKDAAERFQTAEELATELDMLAACPDETLAFGSPWTDMAGAADDGLPPEDDPLAGDLSQFDTLAPATTLPTPSQETASSPGVPGWVWVAIGGGAAVFLLLLFSVVMIFSTKYGTVQIKFDEAVADLEVTVDQETIAIEGLDEPLKLEVGEHNLIVRSPNFETVTRSFDVKRDKTTVVEVTFTPKAEVEGTEAAAYRVTIEPPEAQLAANGNGVSVAGKGAERTVRVAEPDGRSKVTLVATLDGYQNHQQELEPVAGDLKHLTIRLEPIPEPPAPAVYRVTVDPPEAVLTPSDEGVSVSSGRGGARTVTIAEPDGETKITLVAKLDGYRDFRQELQPVAGQSLDLGIRLERMPKTGETPDVVEQASDDQPALLIAPFEAEAVQQAQQDWAEHLDADVKLTNSIGMKLVLIPPGEFLMGSAKSYQELRRLFPGKSSAFESFDPKVFEGELPLHRVRITKAFYLGRTEVTQGQWEDVMGTHPWKGKGSEESQLREGPEYPATYVSWNDAKEFCRRLSQKDGSKYRLPTEAEWEYACRAGTTSIYHFGEVVSRLGECAWFCDNSLDPVDSVKLHCCPVGRKQANAFGLHDMHGNVSEFCQDWYDAAYYAESPPNDPPGPSRGSGGVYRGGGSNNSDWVCRSAMRAWTWPDYRRNSLGFRVVRVPN